MTTKEYILIIAIIIIAVLASYLLLTHQRSLSESQNANQTNIDIGVTQEQ